MKEHATELFTMAAAQLTGDPQKVSDAMYTVFTAYIEERGPEFKPCPLPLIIGKQLQCLVIVTMTLIGICDCIVCPIEWMV